jgi:hypothetical protein
MVEKLLSRSLRFYALRAFHSIAAVIGAIGKKGGAGLGTADRIPLPSG